MNDQSASLEIYGGAAKREKMSAIARRRSAAGVKKKWQNSHMFAVFSRFPLFCLEGPFLFLSRETTKLTSRESLESPSDRIS